MDHIGALEANYKQCANSRIVGIEVDNGQFIERLPQMLARRSRVLSTEVDRVREDIDDAPVRMHHIDHETFCVFWLWSMQARPNLDQVYLKSVDLSLGLRLAKVAAQYHIPALANEVCDIFRDNLVSKTWCLEPQWVREMYDTVAPGRGLLRLIENATRGLRGPNRFLEATEEDAWVAVGQDYPTFFEAFFRLGGRASDLNAIRTKNECHYHDHESASPNIHMAAKGQCPREGDWYPSWLRQSLDVDYFSTNPDATAGIESSLSGPPGKSSEAGSVTDEEWYVPPKKKQVVGRRRVDVDRSAEEILSD